MPILHKHLLSGVSISARPFQLQAIVRSGRPNLSRLPSLASGGPPVHSIYIQTLVSGLRLIPQSLHLPQAVTVTRYRTPPSRNDPPSPCWLHACFSSVPQKSRSCRLACAWLYCLREAPHRSKIADVCLTNIPHTWADTHATRTRSRVCAHTSDRAIVLSYFFLFLFVFASRPYARRHATDDSTGSCGLTSAGSGFSPTVEDLAPR